MRRNHLLGYFFLFPALVAVALFFLLPVALTVVFAFTNMSTATGIMGGDYMLTQSDLDGLPDAGASLESVEKLSGAGYVVSPETLAGFASEFGEDRAVEFAKLHPSASFEAQREMERALKDLSANPIRSTRDRKSAAALFRVSLIGERFDTETEFEHALAPFDIPEPDHALVVKTAYTGWIYTTQNFEMLFKLPATWRYAVNTFIYVTFTIAFNIGFGLFLAISTFYLPPTTANIFRSIWFLPRILPPVLYVLMWTWMTWDQGFISSVLEPFGIDRIDWMRHTPVHAWTTVVLINGCVGASMGMILFSSAIRTIPDTMLYASEVDGANRWQQVRFIILPQMRWPILFVTSYQTLSLLTSFEYILLSTDGGPGRGTEVWALAAYHAALNNYGGNLEYGFGAAYALVLVVIGIAASLAFLRFFNFRELVAKPRIEL